MVPSLTRSVGICTNRFKRQDTVSLGQDRWQRQRNLVEQNRQWRRVHTERRCCSRRHLLHICDPVTALESTTGVGGGGAGVSRCAVVSLLLGPGQQVNRTVSVVIPPPLSNEYLGLIYFRMDWLDLLVVQGTLKSLLQTARVGFPWWR